MNDRCEPAGEILLTDMNVYIINQDLTAYFTRFLNDGF